jgi:hypothetical protein
MSDALVPLKKSLTDAYDGLPVPLQQSSQIFGQWLF